ncbi:MAG: alpha-mannosidase [Oscillospiraceae bacterium]|nr:alpha-mannosidase [Oscillospiraceae bacterium]
MDKYTNKSIHLIGNAHLDPIWLWRWQEGCSEVMQTFRSALDRLNEYDDFVFTCSSASYYRWVEEIDPDMFNEIRTRVKQGRWVPVNGWWVQPDCNIPSGESFARQALYSQLYYHEKFGRICETGYNVDSFGHNWNLPQLLTKGGMRTYVMMRPDTSENPDMPQDLFWWDGPDGTRMLTYRIQRSYARTGTHAIDEEVKYLDGRADEKNHGMMLFYGVGNHGGGPTRGDIEHIISKMDGGFQQLKFSSPDDYFDEMCAARFDIPAWSEDLQHHASGCYSATSMVKQLNRKAENWLQAAEKWNTLAVKRDGLAAATEELAKAWKDVCFNQFHDILCGCSIMEAYEDVRDSMGHAMTIAARAENNALIKLAGKVDTWVDGVSDPVALVRHGRNHQDFPRPVIVFNPLSFPVNVPVRASQPSQRVTSHDGTEAAFQNVRSSRSNDTHLDTLFMAKVPAMGYATYWLEFREWDDFENEAVSDVKADGLTIENEHMRVVFDEQAGGIKSLIGKADGYDYAQGKILAVPTVIDDHKTDTWAHKIFKFHDIKGAMKLESIELIESGPARALVRTKHVFNESCLIQEFILASGQKTLRVKCKAIWQERFTLLKMPFALGGGDPVSTYEIPGAYIKRPCDGDEEPAQAWADLTVTAADGTRRGLSLLNDSKYSYDCPVTGDGETTLRITLLRNVIFADHYSFRPPANFNFTDEGLQRFEYGIRVHTGEAEDSGVMYDAAMFNGRPVALAEGYHKGSEPQSGSFLTVTKPNILVTAFKLCEDGSGDTIIRAYECEGKNTPRVGFVCNLIEAGFWADFGKHEVKTFRIDKDGFVKETDFLEGVVEE